MQKLIGPLPLDKKGSYDFTAVSMSVCQQVNVFSSKRLLWFFWNFSWSYGALRVKNCWIRIFWKKSHFGDNAQKYPQNNVFWILQKKKKKRSCRCRLFGFKSCTIMTYVILLKLHVWEKSGSQVKCKILSANQIAGYSNFNISKKKNKKKKLLEM